MNNQLTVKNSQTASGQKTDYLMEVRSFGSFKLMAMGSAVPAFPTRTTKLLFMYLLLNRGRQFRRSILASRFWPNCPEQESRRKLRTALHRIRKSLSKSVIGHSDYIVSDQRNVGFELRPKIWLDAEEFEIRLRTAVMEQTEVADSRFGRLIRSALSLWRGDFLGGEYQDWCLEERERLNELRHFAIERLLLHYVHCNKLALALGCGQQLVRSNPLCERYHRMLMLINYQMGNRALAIQQYIQCASILDRELSIKPMARTIKLDRALREENQTQIDKFIRRDLFSVDHRFENEGRQFIASTFSCQGARSG